MKPIAKTEHHLLQKLHPALKALADAAGVNARVVTRGRDLPKHAAADAFIDIEVEGKKNRFVVEAKTRVDRLAALGQLKAQAKQWDEPMLLFAPYITTAIAKQCRKLDLPFLDTVGNAYLHMPGLYIYVTGEKPKEPTLTTIGPTTGATATALRVVFALLCRPELLNAPYRDIVKAAGVALGAVGWVFLDLEKRGYIAGKQKNRRFVDAIRLLEEWTTNYPIKLRPKLNPRRFRAENPTWWQKANLLGIGACWGGEVAAHHLTKVLKPATYTIYVEPNAKTALTKLVVAHRLRADPNGDIEVLDAFWDLPRVKNTPDVAPPILAYADLIATLDARNLEAARAIRERYIEHALRTA